MYKMVGGACPGVIGIGLYGRLTLPGGISICLTENDIEITRKVKLKAVITNGGLLHISASSKVNLVVNSDGELEVSTKDMAQTVTVKVSPSLEGVHDATKAYDRLSVVYDEELQLSYISRKDVPAGTALTDTEYWQPYTLGQGEPYIEDTVSGAVYVIRIENGEIFAKQMT